MAKASTCLFYICMVFMITACGGGSSSGDAPPANLNDDIVDPIDNPEDPTNDLEDPMDDSEATSIVEAIPELVVEQKVTIDIPDSMEGIALTLESVYADDTYASEELVLSRIDIDELVIISDGQGTPILLSQFKQGSESYTISSTTTAHALLTMFPGLSEFYLKSPEMFIALLDRVEQVRTLAEAIETNPFWSQGEDPSFIEAFAAAVEHTSKIIEEYKNDFLAGNIKTSEFTSGPRALKLVETPTKDEEKSGVTIRVHGETSITNSPKFGLSISNEYDRYVMLTMGDKLHNYGPQNVLVGPPYWLFVNNHYLEAKLEYDSEIFNDENQKSDDGSLYVTAYGPGRGNLVGFLDNQNDKRIGREDEYYFEASLASVIHYILIPTLKAQLSMPKDDHCLLHRWIGFNEQLELEIQNKRAFRDTSTRDTIIDKFELIDGSKTEYILSSISLLVGVYSNSDSDEDLTYCNLNLFEQKLIEKGIKTERKKWVNLLKTDLTRKYGYFVPVGKVFGGVSDFLTLKSEAEKIYTVSPVFESTINKSQKHESWELTNQHEKDVSHIKISSEMGVDIPADLKEKYKFNGECADGTYCGYFLFQRTLPEKDLPIEFSATCDNDANASERCSNIIVRKDNAILAGGTTDNPDLNGGKAETTLPYASYHEVNGSITITDLDGADAELEFILRAEEARPIIAVQKVLFEDIESGSETRIECESNNSSTVEQLVLFNDGLGDLYPEFTTNSSGVTAEIVVEDSFVGDPDLIEPGGFRQLKVSIDCSAIKSGEEVELKIKDKFISENEIKWIHNFSSQDACHFSNYTLTNYNYRTDYQNATEKYSIEPNSDQVFFNNESELFGLKRGGAVVNIATFLGEESPVWSYELPEVEFSSQDVPLPNYTFKIRDLDNNCDVSFPVNLTMSNLAYRSIAGRTLTYYKHGSDSIASINFKEDGTWESPESVITKSGSYSFLSVYDTYQSCTSGWIEKAVAGAIRLRPGVTSAAGIVPEIILIYEDGSYSSNSHYMCPNGSNYVEIY